MRRNQARPAAFSVGHFGERTMSSFGLYVLGFVVLLGGVGYGAYLLHVPHTWIIVGALVIIGIGIMSAVTRTRRRDPPADAPPV
jgi:hypothetical protein